MKAGLSIEELAAEIMRQNEIKEDYVVSSPCLQMDAWDSALYLRVMNEQREDRLEPLEISENAHRQISARLGIPIKYYNRMLSESPELLTQNVNFWFGKNPEQRMLRVMEGKTRAFLSNRYLRLDNHEITCAVIPEIGTIPDVRFVSSQITEEHLYIKVVNPNLQRELSPGRTIQAGLVICNSEVGLGTFTVSPLIYCPENSYGMIADAGAVKRTHSGPIYRAEENFQLRPEEFLTAGDNAFLEKIRTAVRNTMEESIFDGVVEKMREAIEARINTADVPAVVGAAGNEFGITDSEQSGVLEHLLEQNDMSLYGLASAVTRQSHDSESYERATNLEEISYQMLTMPHRQWERINQTAA